MPERLAAQAAGEPYYFTGKPCRNGHVEKRYTSNGGCIICEREKRARSEAIRPWHPARLAAKNAGDRHYSTGKPCSNGHTSVRYVASGQCVQCASARHARWLAARPGMEAEWARKRRAIDPTGHRAAAKRWAEKNPEKRRALLDRWRENNPERYAEHGRKGALKWRHANRERANAIRREYYHRDIEQSRKMAVIVAATRRARKLQNGGTFTRADIDDILTAQRGKCAECRKKLSDFHIDHIMPLSLGGSNDRKNLQLLCPTCNMQKGRSDPIVFANRKGRLL